MNIYYKGILYQTGEKVRVTVGPRPPAIGILHAYEGDLFLIHNNRTMDGSPPRDIDTIHYDGEKYSWFMAHIQTERTAGGIRHVISAEEFTSMSKFDDTEIINSWSPPTNLIKTF